MIWTEWKHLKLSEEMSSAILAIDEGARLPDAIFGNNLYEVWVTTIPAVASWPEMVWLSIKRYDRRSIHDWRELQRIKNEILGTDVEAVELYPGKVREVDTSNQYHLWAFPPGVELPFGYGDRLVCDGATTRNIHKSSKAKQRAFGPTHEPPGDFDTTKETKPLYPLQKENTNGK